MNAEPKLPPMPDIGTSERDFWCHTPSEMLAYGDARAAHAVAQIKAREVTDAEIDALLQALIWREQFEPRQGEDSNERFERIGENFRRETGFLRPGKDCVLHSYEERQAAWDAWMNAGRERVRAAIALANKKGQP